MHLSTRYKCTCLWKHSWPGRLPKILQHYILEFPQKLYLFLLHTSSLAHRGTSVCFLPYQADIYICEENCISSAKNLYLIVAIKHYFLSSKHTSDKTNYFKWLRATGKAIVLFPKPLNFNCFKGVLKHAYVAIVRNCQIISFQALTFVIWVTRQKKAARQLRGYPPPPRKAYFRWVRRDL